jgi:hypothetical protein
MEINQNIDTTLQESFKESLSYFIRYEKYFNKKQFDFLKSIQHYRLYNELTTKQMSCFISIVDSVKFNTRKYNQQNLIDNFQLKNIFKKILSFYCKDGNPEDFKDKIIKYQEELLSK